MARGANYFAEVPLEGLRWASIFAHTGTAAWYQRDVVPYMQERVGLLCNMSPPAPCRSLTSCNSPNRVAVRSELEVVRRLQCGPPRRKVPNMGCCGRCGPRCGHIGACHSALLAR